jgi:hypothetical protein
MHGRATRASCIVMACAISVPCVHSGSQVSRKVAPRAESLRGVRTVALQTALYAHHIRRAAKTALLTAAQVLLCG